MSVYSFPWWIVMFLGFNAGVIVALVVSMRELDQLAAVHRRILEESHQAQREQLHQLRRQLGLASAADGVEGGT